MKKQCIDVEPVAQSHMPFWCMSLTPTPQWENPWLLHRLSIQGLQVWKPIWAKFVVFAKRSQNSARKKHKGICLITLSRKMFFQSSSMFVPLLIRVWSPQDKSTPWSESHVILWIPTRNKNENTHTKYDKWKPYLIQRHVRWHPWDVSYNKHRRGETTTDTKTLSPMFTQNIKFSKDKQRYRKKVNKQIQLVYISLHRWKKYSIYENALNLIEYDKYQRALLAARQHVLKLENLKLLNLYIYTYTYIKPAG